MATKDFGKISNRMEDKQMCTTRQGARGYFHM